MSTGAGQSTDSSAWVTAAGGSGRHSGSGAGVGAGVGAGAGAGAGAAGCCAGATGAGPAAATGGLVWIARSVGATVGRGMTGTVGAVSAPTESDGDHACIAGSVLGSGGHRSALAAGAA